MNIEKIFRFMALVRNTAGGELVRAAKSREKKRKVRKVRKLRKQSKKLREFPQRFNELLGLSRKIK